MKKKQVEKSIKSEIERFAPSDFLSVRQKNRSADVGVIRAGKRRDRIAERRRGGDKAQKNTVSAVGGGNGACVGADSAFIGGDFRVV